MSFVDIEVKFNKPAELAKRTEFMTLGQGAHTIRILDKQAKTKPTHFFMNSKATVLCLGDDCPICANNKKLIMQFPNNFREQGHYNKINWRFFVNVLDKTPTKVCKCGKEYKNLTLTVCNCGEILPDAQPLNKVKVLSKGLTLRDDLGSIEKAILNPQGDPVGLQNFDVVLMVSGTGRDTKITPVPRTEANEPVAEGLELFDLEKAIIVLDATELLDLQRGIGLKDIFAARRKQSDEKYSKDFIADPVVSNEELEKVNDKINSLFNQ